MIKLTEIITENAFPAMYQSMYDGYLEYRQEKLEEDPELSDFEIGEDFLTDIGETFLDLVTSGAFDK